ncbi:MAG: hypothetical protein GY744_01045 [Gammaproteobacteria bacterium]|nr:hypothetical protein [Gammaproteobacteria bacterium]
MKYSAIKTRIILSIFFMLTFSSCAISINFDRDKVDRNDFLQFDSTPDTDTLNIDSFNGRVIVIAGEDNSKIHGIAKTWAVGKNEEQAQHRLSKINWEFTQSGNTLELKLNGKSGGSHLTELTVPATWNLNIDTANGQIIIPHGFNIIHAESSNGSILITGGDTVIAETSNGKINYNGSSPNFDLDSSNGKIKVQLNGNWNGNGKVYSSNGAISVISSGIIDAQINSSTGNGKSYFYGPKLPKNSDSGKLSLNTSNGNINITHNINVQ